MDEAKQGAGTEPGAASLKSGNHRLMLRDGLTFLSLTLVSIVLGVVTTLLFRSFEAHREALAVQWAQRGRDALEHGRPKDAAEDFRTSLNYDRDNRDNELALAQALAGSGRTSEAESYFLNLWQAQPGDGPINLQLARLERSRGNAETAIENYRAAVFGTWGGDAPRRRRDTRLELAHYLIERGQTQTAQIELLIAAGNNPDAPTQLAIGDALVSAGNPAEAMTAYRQAAADPERAAAAEAKMGALCYTMGGYDCAREALAKALRAKTWPPERRDAMGHSLNDATRLQELSFSPGLNASVRARHLSRAADLAHARVSTCADSLSSAGTPPAVQQLLARWKALDTAAHRAALLHDDEVQEQYATLIFDTETSTAPLCGAPSGDDALLVFLQKHPMTQFGAQQR